jgi:hypothetical protein
VAHGPSGAHDRAAFQIGNVLGLVDHVAGAVLGQPDFLPGIVRVLSLLIAGLAALALPVRAAHGLAVLWINTGFGGQPPDILPVTLLGVAMFQRMQAGVGFDVRFPRVCGLDCDKERDSHEQQQ